MENKKNSNNLMSSMEQIKTRSFCIKLKNLSMMEIEDIQQNLQKDEYIRSTMRITRSKANSLGIDIEVKNRDALFTKRRRQTNRNTPYAVGVKKKTTVAADLLLASKSPHGCSSQIVDQATRNQFVIIVDSKKSDERVTRASKRKIEFDDRKEAPKKRKLSKQSEAQSDKPPISLETQLRSSVMQKASVMPKKNESNGILTSQNDFESDGLTLHKVIESDGSLASNFSEMSLTKSPNVSKMTAVARIDFKIDEVVWAKIKGYPHWPARIKSFPTPKMAIVVWFNDYRTTKLYKTQLSKFLPNFDSCAKKFEISIGLEAAAKEALIIYGNMLAN